MLNQQVQAWAASMAAVLVLAASARGQSTANFDGFTSGTLVTTQYPGLTVSGIGGSGNCTIQAVSAATGQVQSTSSGTRFLAGPVESTSCPTLRLTFASLQKVVTFKGGTHQSFVTPPPLASDGRRVVVTAYDNAGTLISALTQNITVTAANSAVLNIPITVGSATGARNIRRIEVNSYDNSSAALCRQAVLDDLVYCDALDGANPSVTLTSPTDFSCLCPGANVTFSGTIDSGVCGGYASDVLEYRALGATSWTTAAGPYTGLPSGGDSFTGSLYAWTPPVILNGYFYLRSTVYNDAGRSASEVVLVYIDSTPPGFAHLSPQSNALLRGGVCVRGEEQDGPCGATYTVSYLPAGGSSVVIPIAGATWPELANWNTLALPSGSGTLTLTGTDSCGNTTVVNRAVTIDNIAPVARIDSPLRCSYASGIVIVRGQATDAHLGSWALQYTGGDSSGWVTIASGNSPVASGGVIASWNTTGLRTCAYTLRLLVGDLATDNCGNGGNSSEYTVSIDLGCAADFNHSGGTEVQDIFDMLSAWFAGCP